MPTKPPSLPNRIPTPASNRVPISVKRSGSQIRLPSQSRSNLYTDPRIPASHIRALRSPGKRSIFTTMSPAKRSEFIRDCVAVKDDVSKLLKLGWGMYTEDIGELKRAHAHALVEYRLYLEEVQALGEKMRRKNTQAQPKVAKSAKSKTTAEPTPEPEISEPLAPKPPASEPPTAPEPPVITTPEAITPEVITHTSYTPAPYSPVPAYITPEVHRPNLRLQKTREEIHADIMMRLERQNERREKWMQQIESDPEPEWKSLVGLDRNTLEQLKLESAISGLMDNVAAPKVIAIAVSSSAGNDRAALLQGRDTRELSAGAQLALKGVGISRSAQEIRALGQDLDVGKAAGHPGDTTTDHNGAPKTLETPDRVAFDIDCTPQTPSFTPQQLHEEFPEDSGEVQIGAKSLGKGRFMEAVDVKVDFDPEDMG